jgi:hypothetical protein
MQAGDSAGLTWIAPDTVSFWQDTVGRAQTKNPAKACGACFAFDEGMA